MKSRLRKSPSREHSKAERRDYLDPGEDEVGGVVRHGPGVVGAVALVPDREADVELVAVGPDEQRAVVRGGGAQGEVRDALVLVPAVFGEGDLKRSRGASFKLSFSVARIKGMA